MLSFSSQYRLVATHPLVSGELTKVVTTLKAALVYAERAARRGYAVRATQIVTESRDGSEKITESVILEASASIKSPWGEAEGKEPELAEAAIEAGQPQPTEPKATKKGRRPKAEVTDPAAEEIAKKAAEMAEKVDAELATA